MYKLRDKRLSLRDDFWANIASLVTKNKHALVVYNAIGEAFAWNITDKTGICGVCCLHTSLHTCKCCGLNVCEQCRRNHERN